MKKYIIALSAILLNSLISFGQEDRAKLKPIRVDYKYGYGYDDNGGILTIPARYDDALYFEEGLAPVKIGDKWGYIDETGATKIPIKFDYANIFSNGYATVGKTGGTDYLYGIINKAGVLVVPMKYNGIGDLSEGLIAVVVGDKMGFINIKGVLVIPLKFTFTSGQMADFENGFAKYTEKNKVGYIDKTGKQIVFPNKYSGGADFKEGMAVVSKDTNWNKKTSDGSKETSAWGFIDGTGKEVIPCQYENAGSFENGVAQVSLDGYVWHIDKTGKIVDTVSKPIPRRVLAYDSTTYAGKINKSGIVSIMYSGGLIKSVTLNDSPIRNIYRAPIDVNLKKLGLKAGSKATLTIVYTKGTKVWFPGGEGIE